MMKTQELTRLAAAAGPAVLAGSAALAADAPKVHSAELDKAFEVLATFDWGSEPKALNPIDRAIIATEGDAEGRKALEVRLAAVLGSDASRAAKDYACRALSAAGTAASVPALSALLSDGELSHMGRYALQRIPDAEAGEALRKALTELDGDLRIGVIESLGGRQDTAATPALSRLLNDSDAATVAAAATSLAKIGTPEAAKALVAAVAKAPDAAKTPVTDACFRCAERLVADGKRAEAVAVYKTFTGAEQPRHVRLAATRGMLGQ